MRWAARAEDAIIQNQPLTRAGSCWPKLSSFFKRVARGLGGRPDLVFTSPLGKMLHPDSFSEAFVNKVAEIEIKPITFHGLRHTHITLLLRSGVPVHVVSARAGHTKASITLDTYSHLLGGEDNDAAKQAEAILQRVLK